MVVAARPTIEEITETILREYGPVERIILFGSEARGDADEASDIDLIIVKRTKKPFVQRLVEGAVLFGAY